MLKNDNPLYMPKVLGIHALFILNILQIANRMGRGPMQAKEIQQYTPGFGNVSITRALEVLCDPGTQLAIKVNGGWIANSDQAFQLPLGYALSEQERIDENHSQSDSLILDLVAGETGITPRVIPVSLNPENVEDSGLKTGQNHSGSDSGEENPGSIKILIDDESLTNIDSSSIMNPPGTPTLKAILENLNLIFDDALDESDVPRDTSPQLALAWVCKMYRDKLKQGPRLKNPLGTIIVRLRSKQPRKILHLEELPEAYLVAIGFGRWVCPLCGKEWPSEDARNWHRDNEHPDPEPEEAPPDKQVHEFDDPRVEHAWQSVIGQLRMEMPRAAFDNWVGHTRPIGWEDGVLSIAVRSEYNRDWLESRLLSTVARLLAGILDRAVDVRFVVVNTRVNE